MVSTKAVVELKSARRQHKKRTIEDGRRWEEKYKAGESVLKIAKEDGTDPKLVSLWLHRLGIEFKQGHHRVPQPPLKLPGELVELALQGPQAVLDLVNRRAWGIKLSDVGKTQLTKFCEFVRLFRDGQGVEDIAKSLAVHRSTIAEWRSGSDQPYVISVALAVLAQPTPKGTMLLPLHLSSGAQVQSGWIQVPQQIDSYRQIASVVECLSPLRETGELASEFGISELNMTETRTELFAYLLAMLVADCGKSGGEQQRFTSMSLDLQLSLKQPSNARLGRFVCMCANNLGIRMNRIKDKPPSGVTRFGRQPSAAYRWTSERSPIIAWMFSTCLGLKWKQRTSYDKLHMDWIFKAPYRFRARFVQGLADSDGTVKPYEVVITSVPNADFVTALLLSLGFATAHTIHEAGRPLRTMISAREGSQLPIFNEIVKGYRYNKVMMHRPAESTSWITIRN